MTGTHEEDDHHLPLSQEWRDCGGRSLADGRHADLRSDVSGTVPASGGSASGNIRPPAASTVRSLRGRSRLRERRLRVEAGKAREAVVATLYSIIGAHSERGRA